MDLSTLDLLIHREGEDPTCLSAPDSLQGLIDRLENIPNDYQLLYKRKGVWVRVVDDKAYLALVSKALKNGLEEIELRIEVTSTSIGEHIESPPIQKPPEPEEIRVLYKRLNGGNNEFRELPLPGLEVSLQDLSTLILQLENAAPENICALYSEDGYPLTGTLSQMSYTKCSEVLPPQARICVFVIPNFNKRSLDPLDPTLGNDTISIAAQDDATIKYSIKVDLLTTTVEQLKRKLHSLTSVPTHELRLKSSEIYLSQEDKTLDHYGLIDGSALIFYKEAAEFSEFTYKSAIRQSQEQTLTGQKLLHSFLHTFAKTISTSEKPVREAFLAGIRKASNNCTPLVLALYELSEGQKTSLLSSIALEEGFLLLLSNVLSVLQVEPPVAANQLFEHSLEVLSLICDLFSKSSLEQYREESYQSLEILDPLSFTVLKNPVYLKRTDGTYAYFECDSLIEKLDKGESVPEVAELNRNSIVVAPEFKILIHRCVLNGNQTLSVWQGTYETLPTLSELSRQNYPQGVTYSQVALLKPLYKLTKMLRPLSLKDLTNKNCMTLNKDKELCIHLGLSPKMPNTADLMNILTREFNSFDIDDLASALELKSGSAEEFKECITRTPDEAIVVVFDKSSSMSSSFENDREFTRIAATQQFFENFADRTVGYSYRHVMSLLMFSGTIEKICNFTENLSTFAYHVHRSRASGNTRLWDAILEAAEMLNSFSSQYPQCLLRVLCLSDGEDTGSHSDCFAACKKLLSYKITMDSVVVGSLSENLKGISFATGGYVFLPNSIQAGLKLFESETFLSVRNREPFIVKLVGSSADLQEYLCKPFSGEQPSMKAPEQIHQQLQTPSQVIQKTSSAGSAVMKRIMKELSSMNTNPHPNITIYPTANDITFWNAYIEGPDDTPYKGALFHVYIKFQQNYPFSPPEIRFITPIYHCNINATGRICHSILDQFYSPAITVRHILDCIFGLLMTPEPMDPLDANIAAEYQDDYALYERHAREHTAVHANRTLEQLTGGLIAGATPAQFLDPISGGIMVDPVICMKTNRSYERSEIERVIQQTGKDPETGEDISVSDLIPNIPLKQSIEEYKASGVN